MNEIITKKQDIVDTLLGFIDSVEVKDNSTIININSNLILNSEDSLVVINRGSQIFISSQIHLNPDLGNLEKNPQNLSIMIENNKST